MYRMFTDILSRFIIRDTIRTSPLHTPTSVKYEAENEAVEADTKPKVTFKEEEKSSVNHIMYFACLKKSILYFQFAKRRLYKVENTMCLANGEFFA